MASEGGEEEVPRKKRRLLCNGNNNLLSNSTLSTTNNTLCFNDPTTADVKLHLHLYDEESNTNVFDHLNDVHLYLHSDILRRRSQYFSALLSDRWQREEEEEEGPRRRRMVFNLTHKVPASMKSIDTHRNVIELLYSTNDDNFCETINTLSSALSIILVAMEFVFVDCVKACIRLIEALPWTEEEEATVLDLIPLLNENESQELLFRVSPIQIASSHEMLLRLIKELRHNPHQKDFVTMMLFSYRDDDDSIRFNINQTFERTLMSLKEALQSACSSKRQRETVTYWWVTKEEREKAWNSGKKMRHTSTTSWQKEEEKTVAECGSYLCWLIDMMIEWRVADTTTLYKWIDQEGGSLPRNLLKVYSNSLISPEFLFNVILCTWKLANAVATGSIVADTQVRIRLLKDWLPVVPCVKDMVLQFLPELNHRFEEPFYKIISTLPIAVSKVVLLQCLGFNTHNVCPHLVAAYKTWLDSNPTTKGATVLCLLMIAVMINNCWDNEEILSNGVNHQQPLF